MEVLDGRSNQAIAKAVSLLERGEVVAFPTETVYGLGADALNGTAVAKIFEVKGRPHFDPLIVHVEGMEWVERLALTIPDEARLLMDRFWPGPLTIILNKADLIPPIVTSGLSTVALRMPNHGVALNLIRALGRPIAAPSANPFGYMSTTQAGHVADLFGKKLPLILDGGPAVHGIESTIVSIRDGQVCLHRHGAVSIEDLTDAMGPVIEKEHGKIVESPGELPYHYAPHTPLIIIDSSAQIEVENSSFLAFKSPTDSVRSRYVRILSEDGNMREAAAHFFSFLIDLDREKGEIIYAERIPERGLGKAIMERLRKAAQKSAPISH